MGIITDVATMYIIHMRDLLSVIGVDMSSHIAVRAERDFHGGVFPRADLAAGGGIPRCITILSGKEKKMLFGFIHWKFLCFFPYFGQLL